MPEVTSGVEMSAELVEDPLWGVGEVRFFRYGIDLVSIFHFGLVFILQTNKNPFSVHQLLYLLYELIAIEWPILSILKSQLSSGLNP